MPRRTPEAIRPFTLDFTPLRQRRRYMEVTARDLARAVGVHEATLYRTETNRSMPTVAELVAIARALGQPMHTLFIVTDDK